jgi:ribosomal protein S18 acetylase RimI-like enzyme
MADLVLRAALPAELDALSRLAMRSKAHWGYDADFLDACRDELTFTATDLARIVVAESAGALVGMYTVDGRPPHGVLGNLWVDPAAIGSGIGRSLWSHAIASARARGLSDLMIDADPNAEGFYLRMGAERVGETPSGSIPGRVLPLLRFGIHGT